MPSALPFVTVIIPALNVERFLSQCLLAVKNNDYANVEIIVVDNGSVDQTQAIAVQNGARLFVRPDLNISGLRNFGASEARGSILAFLDSDCIAAHDWLGQDLVPGLSPTAQAIVTPGYIFRSKSLQS